MDFSLVEDTEIYRQFIADEVENILEIIPDQAIIRPAEDGIIAHCDALNWWGVTSSKTLFNVCDTTDVRTRIRKHFGPDSDNPHVAAALAICSHCMDTALELKNAEVIAYATEHKFMSFGLIIDTSRYRDLKSRHYSNGHIHRIVTGENRIYRDTSRFQYIDGTMVSYITTIVWWDMHSLAHVPIPMPRAGRSSDVRIQSILNALSCPEFNPSMLIDIDNKLLDGIRTYMNRAQMHRIFHHTPSLHQFRHRTRIIEPNWNETRMEQVISRAVRINNRS